MTGSILVTGASGHLGGYVARHAVAAGARVTGTFNTRPSDVDGVRWRPLDVRDRAAVDALFDEVRPDAVVHTATVPDGNDWAVIADGAGTVAVAAARTGARLVHVSSDAVLSGRCPPYNETAQPDPASRYGAAKAAAETAVRAVAPAAAIVRVSLILGNHDSKHERLVHDLHGGTAGVLYTDLYRMPVHADDLADALLELAAGDHAGVLNVAGPDRISYAELGRLVAARDGLDPARIRTTRAADHDVRLAVDPRLDTTRARALLRTRLRGAREFLR